MLFFSGKKKGEFSWERVDRTPPTDVFPASGARERKRGRGWKPTTKRSTIKSHSVSPLSPWKNVYVRACVRTCICILYACTYVYSVREELIVRRRTTESYSEAICALYRRDAAWLDSADNCRSTVKSRGLLTPN